MLKKDKKDLINDEFVIEFFPSLIIMLISLIGFSMIISAIQ